MVEAVAKWDFLGNGEDFLGFKQGDKIKITALDVVTGDCKWFRAYLKGKHGFVPNYMIDIMPYKWFFGGGMSKDDAERILASKPLQQFIIRETPSNSFQFYLSFKRPLDKKVYHFKIYSTVAEINFHFFRDFKGPKIFHSLNALATYVKKNSWHSAVMWIPYEDKEDNRQCQSNKLRQWSPNV